MLGTERGVGAGGSSKSSRFSRLFDLTGVPGGLALVLAGERWLFRYDNRLGSVVDLVGER